MLEMVILCQHKSNQCKRVTDFGEVYTVQKQVDDMLHSYQMIFNDNGTDGNQ